MSSTETDILAAGLLPPYTMAEVMEMLDCSEDAVVASVNAGDLYATRFGRSWIFPRRAFHRSLDARAERESIARAAERAAAGKAAGAIAKAAGKKPRRRAPPALPSLGG
ncbi:MAG TPA: helix-turn-helix domain-containing protein [Ramlibacter sp.]|nr:helix-turn-helix domain-containing protein [Ramlibacter sp.]